MSYTHLAKWEDQEEAVEISELDFELGEWEGYQKAVVMSCQALGYEVEEVS